MAAGGCCSSQGWPGMLQRAAAAAGPERMPSLACCAGAACALLPPHGALHRPAQLWAAPYLLAAACVGVHSTLTAVVPLSSAPGADGPGCGRHRGPGHCCAPDRRGAAVLEGGSACSILPALYWPRLCAASLSSCPFAAGMPLGGHASVEHCLAGVPPNACILLRWQQRCAIACKLRAVLAAAG